MIEVSHKNTLQEYKKLCAFHMFVARGMRAYIFPAFFFILAVCFLVIAVFAGSGVCYAAAAILFVISFLLPLITLYLQNTKIEKNIRQNPNYTKTEQVYRFEESGFHLRISIGDRVEEHDIPYAQVLRVYERKKYFYIYIGGSQVLILSKDNFSAETANELAFSFRVLGKRFREKKKLRIRSTEACRQEKKDG